MNKIIASLAIILAAGVANATTYEDIYHGFAKGNPDFSYDFVGSHPMRGNVTTSNDIYHGFERGNPDLSTDYEPAHSVGMSIPRHDE